ncbi:centrosomal protein of 131 kDa [Lepus europaeus]|uniref:centrosomal protein of 131 kDa n=1 Tax=Lepus europaeus TaxID=9983 RepID=UPI002B4622CB|nr:centrosomal protein of 131 kDa [Lepus europaeus]
MRGCRAVPSTPEGSPDSVDLCLTGLPPPVSRRPCSASTCRPLVRSVSVVPGGGPRGRALEAAGPRGSRAINNLRRSNSATQVGPARPGSPRLVAPADFLTLLEAGPGGERRPSVEKGATWNVLDDQPRGLSLPPGAQGASTRDSPLDLRSRDCAGALASGFTANNRSSKAAVGNCVTAMLHNQHTPSGRAPAPKSSNHTAPSLNNVIKAATREGSAGSSFRKPPKNLSSGSHVAGDTAGAAGGLRRAEVTEEEAERFIHQVNQAAVTIQRWYRRQVQRRRAGAASLEHLLASKREEQRQRPGHGSLLDLHRQEEAARRKAREEKARQARRAAIQELQQKRAQKSEARKVGASGDAQPAREAPPTPGDAAPQALKANNAGANIRSAAPAAPCPPASSRSSEPPRSPEVQPQDGRGCGVASEAPEVLGLTGGEAKPRATLAELLDTLRLLEEEPEPLPRPRAYHKDRYTWTDEEDDASSLTADNLEKFGQLGAAPEPPADGALLSEAKLQDIVSFLDEMEKSEQEAGAAGTPGAVGCPPEARPCPQGPPELSPAVSTSLMRLRLEVEEKKQAMGLLRRALAQQRDLTLRRVRETEKELGRQLRQQKEHYEAAAQRHLSFIDQLIEDKKVLSEKCAAVVAELRLGDQRSREQVAQMQEQHALEIKKLKELMSATEKVRREKWISEKTKKIKEITVRGLEPEVQKLIARHKQELRRLRSLHEAELQRAEERAAQRCLRQAGELRERLEQEKAELGQRERERAQQRFEQHLQQEQLALEQQRRRLHNEVAEEKERLGQQAARQRAELEESSAALTRALRAEFEKGREEQERRHQAELAALKEQLEAERQAWAASCTKKQEAWLLKRERELQEEMRQHRDQEIEAVIRRLEADMTLAREEAERATESRVKRIRDKYETELLELERSERQLQERCSELKGRLGEAEGQRQRLEALVRQREEELEQERMVNKRLTAERGSLAQVVRQEFADQLAASEEDSRQVKAELAALQARQRLELDEVHQRVKTALAKKEEAVSSLRRQHEAALRRADHLEELLEQQRQPRPSSS